MNIFFLIFVVIIIHCCHHHHHPLLLSLSSFVIIKTILNIFFLFHLLKLLSCRVSHSCVYATRKLQKLQSPVGDCNFEAFCQLPCYVLPLSFRKPKLGMITSFRMNLIENAAKKCLKRQFAFVLIIYSKHSNHF